MFVFNFSCTSLSGARHSAEFDWRTARLRLTLATDLPGMTTRGKQWYFPSVRARLTKDFTFEAAQTLPNAPEGHKCRGVHGHSFKVEVSVEGDVDPKIGWVYDHARISDAMKSLMKMLDHAYLNDIEGLENPTIENMAEWFWKKLESQCPGLCEIVVHETATARCVYRGK
jgi:6-pyruvoyltetrahydropterin/6-carboxytetrahydropterin synthase